MEKIVKRQTPARVNSPEKMKCCVKGILRLGVLFFSLYFSSPLYSAGLSLSELPPQDSAESQRLEQEENREQGVSLQSADEQRRFEGKATDTEIRKVNDEQTVKQRSQDTAIQTQSSASERPVSTESSKTQNTARPTASSSDNIVDESVPQKNKAREEKTEKPKAVRLFNSVDLFRKPIKGVAPKWERVVNLEKKKKELFGEGAKERMPAKVYKQWQALKEKVKKLSDLEKAKIINRFFNQWPYKSDLELWGVTDYWEDPEEFLKRSGDCTDYAITKYYALRSLGIPAEKMRIVALIDRIRGIGHAILAFYHNGTAYVLDNTSALFLEHTKYTHYDPKYSVNEVYRWNHARIIKKARLSVKR